MAFARRAPQLGAAWLKRHRRTTSTPGTADGSTSWARARFESTHPPGRRSLPAAAVREGERGRERPPGRRRVRRTAGTRLRIMFEPPLIIAYRPARTFRRLLPVGAERLRALRSVRAGQLPGDPGQRHPAGRHHVQRLVRRRERSGRVAPEYAIAHGTRSAASRATVSWTTTEPAGENTYWYAGELTLTTVSEPACATGASISGCRRRSGRKGRVPWLCSFSRTTRWSPGRGGLGDAGSG